MSQTISIQSYNYWDKVIQQKFIIGKIMVVMLGYFYEETFFALALKIYEKLFHPKSYQFRESKISNSYRSG